MCSPASCREKIKFRISHCRNASEEMRDSASLISANTVTPSHPWLHILQFQLPMVNCGTKKLNGKFQKQKNSKDILKERDHIHITFITVYYLNCSILWLVIVVNLLRCLIYKLNFIIGMYLWENTVCEVCSTIRGFSRPLGGFGTCLPWMSGGCCTTSQLSAGGSPRPS